MEEQPIFTFTSHIEGKNAKVSVYQDRLEWVKPRGLHGGKITAGVMTGGISFLATGFKSGKSGTEMIPIKNISSVTTSRDGMLNSKVSVITSGNTIDFRVSHGEAAEVKKVLTQLVLGTHPAQKAQGTSASAPTEPQRTLDQRVPPSGDVIAQIAKLGELKAAGVLNDDEFTKKKAELLGRL